MSPSQSLVRRLLPVLLLVPPSCVFVGAFLTTSTAFVAPVTSSPSYTTTTTTTCQSTATSDSSSSSSSSPEAMSKKSASAEGGGGGGSVPKFFQHEISITAPSRGCHLITREVQNAVKNDIGQIKIGLMNLFIQHTSASLTINENADPDVRRDMEMALNKIVPASWNHDGTFRHTMEGDDDMPGHVKSSLMGPSLNIPIRNGKLALGTWQGIYLNEHRDQGGWGGGHTRRVIITLQGTS